MGEIIFRNLQGNPHTPIDTSTGEVLVREGAKVKQKSRFENLPDANQIVENYEKRFQQKQKSIKDIKNKADLVQFIKDQTGYQLENDPNDFLNKRRNELYTKIPREKKNSILGLLRKYGFSTSEHLHDYYWVSVKPKQN